MSLQLEEYQTCSVTHKLANMQEKAPRERVDATQTLLIFLHRLDTQDEQLEAKIEFCIKLRFVCKALHVTKQNCCLGRIYIKLKMHKGNL